MRIKGVLVVVATLSVLAVQADAQEEQQVTITVEQVGTGTYALFGRGGNIGISAGEDGIFLVDDQFAPLTPAILEAIKRVDPGPVRFVINTHFHGDHTGGNENLGKQGALIVAHDKVRERMSVEQFNEAFNRTTPPSPKDALPVVTFGNTVGFHLNGDEIRGIHVPGAHTDGDTVIYFRKANVIHAGDLYFNERYPFIDLSAGGSVFGMIDAANLMLQLADEETAIIPGHGPVANAEELRAYRDMLVTIRDRIAALIEEGKSLEEVVVAKPTEEYDEVWGNNFIKPEQMVGFVYDSLKAHKN